MAKTTRTRLSNQKTGSSSQPERIWYPAKRYPFRIPELPESVNTPIGHLRFLQNASFRWRHWDYCRDRKAAVFEFVEGADSPSQKAARHQGSQQNPQHGLVSFFPEDGTVCRLVISESGMHSHGGYTSTIVSTMVTIFGPVNIDHHTYWFPTKFVTMGGSDQSSVWLRNVAIATEYHKVNVQSTVTYTPPAFP